MKEHSQGEQAVVQWRQVAQAGGPAREPRAAFGAGAGRHRNRARRRRCRQRCQQRQRRRHASPRASMRDTFLASSPRELSHARAELPLVYRLANGTAVRRVLSGWRPAERPRANTGGGAGAAESGPALLLVAASRLLATAKLSTNKTLTMRYKTKTVYCLNIKITDFCVTL
ncbi:unnamed protein product [Euphydryas editha]|uniref:Uncharacterized protein n=1 Tax=Euphydryas editha TaxID=104508 RepID=A0AAU9TQG7_EUPED|nr:unnamed protein product [Euphydryas editha]